MTLSLQQRIEREAAKLPRPIAIFGASGFIGQNLSKWIPGAYLVSRRSMPGLHVSLDISDKNKVDNFFDAFKPATVFNLSAYGSHPDEKDTYQIYKTNILGLDNILRNDFSVLVNAGTSSEYGYNCQGPKESDYCSPNSEYSISKVTCSHMIRLSDHNAVNLRYYSIYGPGERADRLIPTLIRAAKRGELPQFVNPLITRDFVYIDDCILATLMAANSKIPFIQDLNVCSGKMTSLKGVAEIAKRVFSIDKEPEFTMPARDWDLEEWYGNPELINSKLGWRAETTFEQGLKLTYDAYCDGGL